MGRTPDRMTRAEVDAVLWDVFDRPQQMRANVLADLGHVIKKRKRARGQSPDLTMWDCTCGAEGVHTDRKLHEDWALARG